MTKLLTSTMCINRIPLSTSILLDEVAIEESEDTNSGDNEQHSADSAMSRTTLLARLKFDSKTSSTEGRRSTSSNLDIFNPCDSKIEQ